MFYSNINMQQTLNATGKYEDNGKHGPKILDKVINICILRINQTNDKLHAFVGPEDWAASCGSDPWHFRHIRCV